MAKNADVSIAYKGPFISCRGGSKLQFGGSYVKIGQELASEMHFLSR